MGRCEALGMSQERRPSGWERRVVPGRGSGEDAMGWRGGCIAPALTSAMLVAFRLAGFDASRTVLRSGGENDQGLARPLK